MGDGQVRVQECVDFFLQASIRAGNDEGLRLTGVPRAPCGASRPGEILPCSTPAAQMRVRCGGAGAGWTVSEPVLDRRRWRAHLCAGARPRGVGHWRCMIS
jgi:hypothetical protein